jgi:hypothetical protein
MRKESPLRATYDPIAQSETGTGDGSLLHRRKNSPWRKVGTPGDGLIALGECSGTFASGGTDSGGRGRGLRIGRIGTGGSTGTGGLFGIKLKLAIPLLCRFLNAPVPSTTVNFIKNDVVGVCPADVGVLGARGIGPE